MLVNLAKEDFLIGMQELNSALNLADQIQPLIMERILAEKSSLDLMDFVTFQKLWFDLATLLTPLKGKLDSLQSSELFKALSLTSDTSDLSGAETLKKKGFLVSA